MKKFRVTVNGQTYEVEVEEIDAGEARPAPAEQVKGVVPKEAKAPKPAVPAKREEAAVSEGGEAVKAPLPGVVVDVKVEPGQKVRPGDVLVVLEAMKMENEIPAPIAGTVREVAVSQGQSVSVDDVLVVIG